MRGATTYNIQCIHMTCISIHAPHARSDSILASLCMVDWISIHAPHARSDVCHHQNSMWTDYFNPRSSCEERPSSTDAFCCSKRFQSTLLMRGATALIQDFHALTIISIHAPHARSDFNLCDSYREFCISIHAPHARSDHLTNGCCESLTAFQSTLLMRGATNHQGAHTWHHRISIHAPHARSDSSTIPRTVAPVIFQSTLLMRGATFGARSYASRAANFNPRSSCEERRKRV